MQIMNHRHVRVCEFDDHNKCEHRQNAPCETHMRRVDDERCAELENTILFGYQLANQREDFDKKTWQ